MKTKVEKKRMFRITKTNANKNVRRTDSIDISDEARYTTSALKETKGLFYHGKS